MAALADPNTDLKRELGTRLRDVLRRLRHSAASGHSHDAVVADDIIEKLPDSILDAIHQAGFAVVPQLRSNDVHCLVTHSHPNGCDWRDPWRVDLSLDGGTTALWAEQEVQSPLMQHTNPEGFRRELAGWLIDVLAGALEQHVKTVLGRPVALAVAIEDQRRREAAAAKKGGR